MTEAYATNGYTDAAKPPVRRTGKRYACGGAAILKVFSFQNGGRQLVTIIRLVRDPDRIPLSWSGSWRDRSELC